VQSHLRIPYVMQGEVLVHTLYCIPSPHKRDLARFTINEIK